LIAAVASFADNDASEVNGSAAATTVATPRIRPKKTNGWGTNRSRGWIRPVAMSVAAKAQAA
jgi:hypothetical protein